MNFLQKSYEKYKKEYDKKALDVLHSGCYILGPELDSFEREFADYLGVKHCVGVASGLDALTIAVHLLGVGRDDEVIVPANTYIATVMGITRNGALPVFVEPDIYFSIDVEKIEKKITSRTKAIMAVHLYGMPCQMDIIKMICDKYNLYLIEDCAQSHGAKYAEKKTGTFGNAGCFSFYPTKNLGGFGDGGCIVTEDDELAKKARVFRNYGSEKKYHNMVVGVNSRLDELQAGLLRIKLKYLDALNDERTMLAKRYSAKLTNRVIKPLERVNSYSVWHQYVIMINGREKLQDYLTQLGIHTAIHYPIPPHMSEAYNYLEASKGDYPITESYASRVLSLPLYNGMDEVEQNKVIEAINVYRGEM